jgi:hypothetical protein
MDSIASMAGARRVHSEMAAAEEGDSRRVQPRLHNAAPHAGGGADEEEKEVGAAAAAAAAAAASVPAQPMYRNLDANCLAIIFSFLSLRDLARGQRICKHWARALGASEQLANLRCHPVSAAAAEALCDTRSPHPLRRHLQALELECDDNRCRCAREISDQRINLLLQCLPNSLPNLQHLRVSVGGRGGPLLPARSLEPHGFILRTLHIDIDHRGNDTVNTNLRAISTHTQLHTLHLQLDEWRGQEKFDPLLVLPHLRELVMPPFKSLCMGGVKGMRTLRDEDALVLARLPQVERFWCLFDPFECAAPAESLLAVLEQSASTLRWTHWYAHHWLDDGIVAQMAKLTHLRVVSLCVRTTCRASDLHCLAELPHLSDLYLTDTKSIHDEDMEHFWDPDPTRGARWALAESDDREDDFSKEDSEEEIESRSSDESEDESDEAAAARVAAEKKYGFVAPDQEMDGCPQSLIDKMERSLPGILVGKLPLLPRVRRLFIDGLNMRNSELKALLKLTPELRELTMFEVTGFLDYTFLDGAVPLLQRLHIPGQHSFTRQCLLTLPLAARLQRILTRKLHM